MKKSHLITNARSLAGLMLGLAWWCGSASGQTVQSARIDKRPDQAEGTVVARIGTGERRIASSALHAWVAMNGAGVLYTERSTKAGSPPDAETLRLWEAKSELTRTVADENGPVRDVMQDLLPNGKWVFVLTVESSGGIPSVSLVKAERGVVRRYAAAKPETIQQDVLLLQHYDRAELLKAGADAKSVKPVRTERIPLTELAAQSSLSGIYEGKLPAADAAARNVVVELRPGGTAVVRQTSSTRGTVADPARWAEAEGVLTLTFQARSGRTTPRALSFGIEGETLAPSDWSSEEWGANGPPVLHRTLAFREPHQDCRWERWADSRLGVGFRVETCPDGDTAVAAGYTVRRVKKSGSAADSPVLIEVYQKRADQGIDAAIRERVLAGDPAAAGCSVQRSARVRVNEPSAELWEVRGTDSTRGCGAHSSTAGYFEYHPQRSRERFLFIYDQPGESIVDEQSIRILR